MKLRALLALLTTLCMATVVQAETFYVNSGSGDDTNSGLAGAPWRTWHQLLVKIGDGTIKGDDKVLMYPGFYPAWENGLYRETDLACKTGGTCGGTEGHPVTISIDTAGEGDVQIEGAGKAGSQGNGPLVQAMKCSGGDDPGTVCDSSDQCAGGGTCVEVPGVYYMSDLHGTSESFGKLGGTAFERAGEPGSAPKFYETLYSPQVEEGHPVIMPEFTDGHDEFWPYAQTKGQCTKAHMPWACCTGSQQGSCEPTRRAYIHRADGSKPDSTYIPMGNVLHCGTDYPEDGHDAQYITFTNDNNGRRFHFWWATTTVMYFHQCHHMTFEDFTVQYNSSAMPCSGGGGYEGQPCDPNMNPDVASGSGFPRNLGGPIYLLVAAPGHAPARTNDITFRRGRVGYAAGDEAWHWSGGDDDSRQGNLVIDQVEIAHIPWAVPNGQAPNGNSVAQSWPPKNYPDSYKSYYPTHWSPLGGGGQSPGAFIIQTPNTLVRNSYIHDAGQISFRESSRTSQTFEGNLVDGAFVYYGGHSGAAPVANLPTTACPGIRTGGSCQGFDGTGHLMLNGRTKVPGDKGFIVRNNVFINGYGNSGSNIGGDTDGSIPSTSNQFINNTIHLKGDALYGPNAMWTWGVIGSEEMPAIIRNNIIVREEPGGFPAFEVTHPEGVIMDNNLWGTENMKWRWGNQTATAFGPGDGTWLGIVSQTDASLEAHSVSGDPQFIAAYTNMHIQETSPAFEKGADLSALGFHWDFDGTERPAGKWSIGAYQGAEGPELPDGPGGGWEGNGGEGSIPSDGGSGTGAGAQDGGASATGGGGPGNGGNPALGGASANEGDAADDSGCSCRVGSTSGRSHLDLAAFATMAALATRRRRRARVGNLAG